MITRKPSAEKYAGLTSRGDACTGTVAPAVSRDGSENELVEPPGVDGASEVKATC